MDEDKLQNTAPAEEVKEYGLDPKEDYSEMDEITARIRARKMEQARRKKQARTRARILLGVALAVIACFIFSLTSFFTVDSIEVRGNDYFTEEEIINMGHATAGKNLIYKPNKRQTVKYLEENPYIRHASVTRSFPSTLVINVEERKQIGAIRYDKEFLIIDEEGILLRKTKTTPKLTLIEGNVVRKIQPGETIGVKDQDLLEQTLALLRSMRDGDLYFVRLDMTGRYIKAYIYDSLVCKGTFEQLNEAMNNERLHRVVDELFEDNVSRGTITFSDDNYASFVPTV